jgi:dihydroorotate dehydrogenase/ferredoxin
MVDVDLSVKVGPLTFKNPILNGASGVAADVKTVKKCIRNNVGGVILKSLTHVEFLRTRYVPTYFFMDPLGPEYRGLMGHGESFSMYDVDEFVKTQLPEIVKECRKAEIPLIGSVLATNEVEEILYIAKKLCENGCDAIEIDAGCSLFYTERLQRIVEEYSKKKGKDVKMGAVVSKDEKAMSEIISTFKKELKVPVYVKIDPYLEPLENFTESYVRAGADGITAFDSFGTGIAIDWRNETPFFATWTTGGYTAGLFFVSMGKIVRILKKFPELYVSGCGGVRNVGHVVQYLLIGCKTVQVATAIFYYGHKLFNELVEGLKKWMEERGYSSVKEFTGKLLKYYRLPRTPPINYPPTKKPYPYEIVIDMSKCTLCGRCQDVCFYDLIQINREAKTIDVNKDECWNCGLCVGVCPQNAIKMVDRITKEVIWENKGLVKTF